MKFQRRNNISLIWAIALLIPFMFSCKVARDTKRTTNIYRNPQKVIELTQGNDLEYQALSLKANISLSDGKKKTTFKASIRMFRDSVIWSSFTLIGIAGAKTLITNDSIMLVNYKDKNYVSEPYVILEEYLNSDLLSLPNLQKLLLGDWLYVADYDKYRLKYNDTNYVVSTISERRIDNDWLEKKIDRLEKRVEKQEERDADKAQELLEKKQERKPRKYEGMALEVEIDPFEYKIRKLLVKDYYFEGSLKTEYSDFEKFGDKTFPQHVNMTVDGRKYLNLDIEYYKISLEDEMSIPFSIPKKYERIKL